MTVSYASIKNNKGMSAQVIACAYGDSPDESYGRKTLYSLDIAGAHTAVKAIWASVMSGSPLTPAGFARYKVLRAEKETEFLLVKTVPLEHVHHYHIVAAPKPTAPYLVLTSQLGVSREEGLARYLTTYTLYPVIPDWAEVLFGEGSKRKLIRPLETFGLAWAYRIETWGWDEVLDEAAKGGLLTFPTSN
jgi:hypothetical protein